ncbi:MAG: type III-A CRISPR-associated protein Cas10/Csm1 [Chloroflexi bacterium]|nr:type III-A CRISPR-associated protein Cas10/Csm1 [Chloroflexota bacterium]
MNPAQTETLLLAALQHDLGALFGSEPPAAVRAAANDAEAQKILDQACAWATPGGTHSEPLATTPLVSIFSLLRRDKIPAGTPQYFDLHELGATNEPGMNYLFPVAQTKISRHGYLKNMREKFNALAPEIAHAAFDVQFNHLTAFLQRYARCLPAHSPDVCLYDHLRLTAALAACLAQKPADSSFTLVVGDLSGIQDYIFDIATIGASGASRRLRARSFAIGLISDFASHALVREFGLPLTNVLMASGGKFYILLPKLSDTPTRLDAFRAQVEGWLFQQYNGEIGLNLAAMELSAAQLDAGANGFGAALKNLGRELGVAKLQRSRAILQNATGWVEEQFIRRTDFEGAGICRSCGKFPGTERDELCKQCAQQSRLGSKLTRAQAIAFFENDTTQTDDLTFLERYSARVVTEREPIVGSPYLMVQINNSNLRGLIQYPATFRYLANHVPLGDYDAPKTFEQIAEASLKQGKGRELLGYVKADGDRMGTLFSSGLRAENKDTAAHVVAFSREMELFFAGWLDHELNRNFEDTYTIFSGGDDLFLLTPWTRALDLARRVNEKFREFVCANEAVTLSAGILYTKPRYPVARAAPDVETVLEQSKRRGRNRLTVLGDTFEWQYAADVQNQVDDLAGFTEEELRASFLHRLVYYGQEYRKLDREGKADAARFKSHLAYTIARNLRGGNARLLAWGEALFNKMFANKRDVTTEHLGLIATIVLFNRRTRR